ncbi:hypothetical protein ACTA71_010651 [Dictyostelium dimigraforme]
MLSISYQEENTYTEAKCYYHDSQDLSLFCLDCGYAVCNDCKSSKDYCSGHRFDLISNSMYKIKQEFEENFLPLIPNRIKKDKTTRSLSDSFCTEIVNKLKLNQNIIKEEFRQIHLAASLAERDILLQLDTTYDENLEIKLELSNRLIDHIEKLQEIINNRPIIEINDNNNNNNFKDKKEEIQNNNQEKISNLNNIKYLGCSLDGVNSGSKIFKGLDFELIKSHQYSKIILSNDENNKLLGGYKKIMVNTNKKEVEKARGLFKSMLYIEEKGPYYRERLPLETKTITWKDETYGLFISGGEQIFNEKVAFNVESKSINHLRISSTSGKAKILFMDGFEQQIPNTLIQHGSFVIHFGNIKRAVLPGSIPIVPNETLEIYFENGYCHHIGEGVIPKCGLCLYLGELGSPLTYDSIPSKIRVLCLMDGFNQNLNQGIIPEFKGSLYLGNIKTPILNNSIPRTISKILFLDNYPHKIFRNQIPSGVDLHFGDIVEPLTDQSIPHNANSVHFNDGFNHFLTKGVIPSTVESISFGNIKKPLTVHSIPNGVKKIVFTKTFNQSLDIGIIPNSVLELFFDNQQPLSVNSIPPSSNVFITVEMMDKKYLFTISSIILFKACKGIEVEKCKLTEYGLENDRRWMIINNGRYVGQKPYPVLSTVKTEFSEDGSFLIISKEGIEKKLKISTKPLNSNEMDPNLIYSNISTLDNISQCYDQGDEAAQWFSNVMNDSSGTIRFVQMCPPNLWKRNVRKHMGDNLKINSNNDNTNEEYKNSLSNSCQIMFLSNSSIEDLNKRVEKNRMENGESTIDKPPLKYDRFRPNLIIDGTIPFQEDNWKSIEIENQSTTVELKIADGNARCPVVTIDQELGVLDPYNDDEPLRTLKTFRKVECVLGQKVLFGTYAVTNFKDVGKFISIGDKINILDIGFKSNFYTEIKN